MNINRLLCTMLYILNIDMHHDINTLFLVVGNDGVLHPNLAIPKLCVETMARLLQPPPQMAILGQPKRCLKEEKTKT